MHPALSVSQYSRPPREKTQGHSLGLHARPPHQNLVTSPPINTSTMGDETVTSET